MKYLALFSFLFLTTLSSAQIIQSVGPGEYIYLDEAVDGSCQEDQQNKLFEFPEHPEFNFAINAKARGYCQDFDGSYAGGYTRIDHSGIGTLALKKNYTGWGAAECVTCNGILDPLFEGQEVGEEDSSQAYGGGGKLYDNGIFSDYCSDPNDIFCWQGGFVGPWTQGGGVHAGFRLTIDAEHYYGYFEIVSQIGTDLTFSKAYINSTAGEPIIIGEIPIACVTDLSGDGITNVTDFISFNSAFNSDCNNCPEDLDGNGTVDIGDFLLFNSTFGQSCE